MLEEFISQRFPQYLKMNKKEKLNFLNSSILNEDVYEEYRDFIGISVFERNDFSSWSAIEFNDFFTHEKYMEFDLLCSEFISQRKDNFYLSDKKFDALDSLYENDYSVFEYQKNYVSHLINYHPFPFEEIYSLTQNIKGKKEVVSGFLSSFQRVFTSLMLEFCIRHSHAIESPDWVSDGDFNSFRGLLFREVKDDNMYSIISKYALAISEYMESNDFIYIDKMKENFYGTEMSNWNFYISSVSNMKKINISSFMDSISDSVSEEIPDDFKEFFINNTYACISEIIKAFSDKLSSLSLNQIGFLSNIKKFEPIKIIVHASLFSDIESLFNDDDIDDLDDNIDDLDDNIIPVDFDSRVYDLKLFNSIFIDKNYQSGVDNFIVEVSTEILKRHPELEILVKDIPLKNY